MLLRVGRVGKPHGLNGEVKVVPDTEDPSRLEGIKELFVGESAETAKPFGLARIRFQPYKSSTTILLDFQDIDTIDGVRPLRGLNVYARESDLPELDEGEWYLDDLAGMSVRLEDGQTLGEVIEVLDLPGHPILVIQRQSGSETMIPAVEEFVVSVDPEQAVIVVRLIEGLVEGLVD